MSLKFHSVKFINSPKRVLLGITPHHARFVFSPKVVNLQIVVLEAAQGASVTLDGAVPTLDGGDVTLS